MEKTQKNKIGLFVGSAGVVLTILSLFMPFAKAGKYKESLVDLAKLYINEGSEWLDKDYASFYKIFVPLMVGLIALFAVVYLIKCIKAKKAGMIISTILTIASYEILKWDFKDRGVVSGSSDKGVAFTAIYIAFALLIVGAVLRTSKKNDNSDEVN